MIRPLNNIRYGSDPEAFFYKDGKIIGSERIVPEGGFGYIIRDGVQFEINTPPTKDIAGLAHNISRAFRNLNTHLRHYPETQCCFDGMVEVSRKELNSLSLKSRVLGCMPSKNIYGVKPITVDAVAYRKRSAGGHIHLGLRGTPAFGINGDPDERHRAVPLCDIFVGNSCVLLDRDPGAAERRENYGRAGEYRLPEHGLEYRTISNFWLRGYPLMSFVFGMANLSISVLSETLRGNNLEQELVDTVDIRRVIKAIDTNNFELALLNFNDLLRFFNAHLPDKGFPIGPRTIRAFIRFVEGVHKNGIERYFPKVTIVDRWVNLKAVDFQEFLQKVKL